MAPSSPIRRSIVAAVAVASLVVGFAWVPSYGSVTATDLLPDLRMALPHSFTITRPASGRRLLRFTTRMINTGRGPFAVRASRSSTGQPTMTVRQRIYDSAGGWRWWDTSATAKWAGDGHDHWHVQNVARYELFRANGTVLVRGAKVGFCFFDTSAHWTSLPGSPSWPRYRESGCGTRSSLAATMGISVGWGDQYGWDFAYQWIDITGLVSGEYWVRVQVDAGGSYREANESNDCAWARIRIPSSGSRVSLVLRGTGCNPPGVGPGPTPTPTPTPTPEPTPTPPPEEEPPPDEPPPG